jgi:hypothetical protein
MAPRAKPKESTTNPNAHWQREGLSECQVNSAILQSMGYPLRHVAKEVGVTAWTLTQWQKLPAYRSLVAHYLDDIARSTLNQCLNARKAALNRLTNIVINPDSDDRTAVQAAGIILAQPVNIPAVPRSPEELEEDDRLSVDLAASMNRKMQDLLSVL